MKVRELNVEYFKLDDDLNTTLAYWILAPREGTDLSLLTADELYYKLASQCDQEDQASVGDDDCLGDPEFFRGRFFPLAPVQFVELWSPFPFAAETLGDARVISIAEDHEPCACVIWDRTSLTSVPRLSLFASREKRFSHRFYTLVSAAFQKSSSICVVATPGWEYESRKLSSVAQDALRAHGFKFTTRAP